MRRLTDSELDNLQATCSGIAHAQWDGRIEVEQNHQGVLTIYSHSEDDEVEATCTATPEGEWSGQTIYALRLDGEETPAYATLVPTFIMGYLAL